MNSENCLSIAYKWFDAFNKKDIDQLLSLYDDNAEHFSPKLKIRKPETRTFLGPMRSERIPAGKEKKE